SLLRPIYPLHTIFFNTPSPTDISTLSLHDALPILLSRVIRDPAEIEDVAQEAFIKAYRALPNFRGDSAFYTWLYRIGINTEIGQDRKSTRLNSSHVAISYAVFCLKKKKK